MVYLIGVRGVRMESCCLLCRHRIFHNRYVTSHSELHCVICHVRNTNYELRTGTTCTVLLAVIKTIRSEISLASQQSMFIHNKPTEHSMVSDTIEIPPSFTSTSCHHPGYDLMKRCQCTSIAHHHHCKNTTISWNSPSFLNIIASSDENDLSSQILFPWESPSSNCLIVPREHHSWILVLSDPPTFRYIQNAQPSLFMKHNNGLKESQKLMLSQYLSQLLLQKLLAMYQSDHYYRYIAIWGQQRRR